MNTQNFFRRWSTLAVLGTMATTPLMGVAVAQVGERYSQNDRRFEDDRYDVRVVGVVTREVRGNRFELRADDGKEYRVSVRDVDNVRVVVGDRVQVTGRMNGKNLVARHITQIGINPGGGGALTILRGVVVSSANTSSIEIRADDGRFHRVRARNSNLSRFRMGDRVEARGYFDRDRIFIAESVELAGSGNGQRVTVRGAITNIIDAAVFEMRGEDGVTYRVQGPFRAQRSTSPVVRVGDRIEVRGTFDTDRILIAENVRIIDNGNAGGTTGPRITRRGTITNVIDAAVFEMRGDDGITYRVQGTFRAQRNTAPVVRIGDRVEVRGAFDRDRILIAENVNILDRREDGGTVGTRVKLQGTVYRVFDANAFDLRTDDGRVYRINTRNNDARRLAVDQRVDVTGTIIGSRTVITDSVRVVGYGNDSGGSQGNQVNFTGIVTRTDRFLMLYTLHVRSDNGQQHQVFYNGANTFEVNDRVRVIGTVQNGRVVSNNISRW